MALEFICVETIMEGKKISLPGEANCYRTKSGSVKFFRSNPTPPEKIFVIPETAREMSFEGFARYAYWTSYGNHTFYDIEGNIIKAEE